MCSDGVTLGEKEGKTRLLSLVFTFPYYMVLSNFQTITALGLLPFPMTNKPSFALTLEFSKSTLTPGIGKMSLRFRRTEALGTER